MRGFFTHNWQIWNRTLVIFPGGAFCPGLWIAPVFAAAHPRKEKAYQEKWWQGNALRRVRARAYAEAR